MPTQSEIELFVKNNVKAICAYRIRVGATLAQAVAAFALVGFERKPMTWTDYRP